MCELASMARFSVMDQAMMTASSAISDLTKHKLIAWLLVFWFFAAPLGLIANVVFGPPPSMLLYEIILLGILSWLYSAYWIFGDVLEVSDARWRAGRATGRFFETLYLATLGLIIFDGIYTGIPAMIDLLATMQYGFVAVYIGILGALLAAASWVYMQMRRAE